MPPPEMPSQNRSQSYAADRSSLSLRRDGLGIYTTPAERNRNNPLPHGAIEKSSPGFHHRSTSGTSQISAASHASANTPASRYAQPIGQSPVTSNPIHGRSASESDDVDKRNRGGETSFHPGTDALSPSTRATPGQRPRLSLQTYDGSFTKLPGTSQTNVATRRSFGYSREPASTLDTASPASRTSLDFVFRSKTRTSTDPISRAATVQAARQAFEEKEAAKTRKLEAQQIKAEEKHLRRMEKQYWRTPLKDDDIGEPTPEKENLEPHPTLETRPLPSQHEPNSGNCKSPRDMWMHFLTWLRTKLFKLQRRMKSLV
ncbi:hypothetical protein P168DRAFT_71257 [Aspergillus campestris IBT 28561]|uniref:Uncharacterized protein n=1 Tax=Aspergillus campestris (strain IBT 28561) TaxID=1392248 RepID=A0A2I1CSR3_ASPC2|nr:uncharacterized protein P168DRAFT_71257 [Aspergillus campestris IBT 28561]PKY00666.1 hypothetical protein P168DRAFT_71257 [Aspergillus campestris IBT 28561]